MSSDEKQPVTLHLHRNRLKRIEDAARARHTSQDAIVEEAIDAMLGEERDATEERVTVYEALRRKGLIGCITAPPDLSTNPAYFEGFGRD